jgi:hypothetical protein
VQACENAGGEDDRAAREDRADDGERFEERGDEDDAERDARVRREDADQRLQVRFQAREPLAYRHRAHGVASFRRCRSRLPIRSARGRGSR